MKKLLLFFVMLTVTVAMSGAEKAKTVFTLDHQMSEHCEKKIKENLRYESGVSNIEVSLKENTITVTYAPDKTNDRKLLEGFKKIGFNAFVVNPECENAQQGASQCCGNHGGASCGNNATSGCGNHGAGACPHHAAKEKPTAPACCK